MEAIIDKEVLTYGEKSIKIDELFDDSFYEYANKYAPDYINRTYGVNEVYDVVILYYLAIKKWVEENTPNIIDLKKANYDYALISMDIASQKGIKIKGRVRYAKVKSAITFKLYLIGTLLYICYLLIKIPYVSETGKYKKFALLRSKSAIKKFKCFPEIHQEVEDPYKADSVYRLFTKKDRLRWAIVAYFKSCESMQTFKQLYSRSLGTFSYCAIRNYYKKRILHAEVYSQLLDAYFVKYGVEEFYTGNNLDRFSVIEDFVSHKYGIHTFNIPHGIEYGFRFPLGFSSDAFYANSGYAAEYLNKLYGTEKYVFNKEMISRMYKLKCGKPHDPMIVFFTEPREINVNKDILERLLPKLEELNKPLYLKLHPLDSKDNYKEYNVNYVNDYELSLSGNICISRKSTILIEAIYNDSLPVAIITNAKDRAVFNNFPALNAKEIIKTNSVDELFEVIQKNIKV